MTFLLDNFSITNGFCNCKRINHHNALANRIKTSEPSRATFSEEKNEQWHLYRKPTRDTHCDTNRMLSFPTCEPPHENHKIKIIWGHRCLNSVYFRIQSDQFALPMNNVPILSYPNRGPWRYCSMCAYEQATPNILLLQFQRDWNFKDHAYVIIYNKSLIDHAVE